MQMLESVFVWLFPLNFYLQFLSFFQCLSSLLCVTLRLAGLASSSPAFSSNPSCLLINIWSQNLSFKIFFHIYVVVSLERKNGSCSRTLYSLCRGRLAHIELAKCSHKQGDTVLDASGSHQSGSFEEDELTQSSLKPDLKPDVQSKFSLSLSLSFLFLTKCYRCSRGRTWQLTVALHMSGWALERHRCAAATDFVAWRCGPVATLPHRGEGPLLMSCLPVFPDQLWPAGLWAQSSLQRRMWLWRDSWGPQPQTSPSSPTAGNIHRTQEEEE